MELKRLINRAYWGPVDWDWDKVRECTLESYGCRIPLNPDSRVEKR